MIIVGSTYWNIVYGKNIGDVLSDDEGMANICTTSARIWHGW